MSFAVVAAVGSAVVGGAIASKGAKKAANTQADAAREGAELQNQGTMAGIEENRRQFDVVRELLAPYIQSGNRGTGAYEALVGLGGAPAQQEAINGILTGPQFGTLTRQGEEAILQNASATGGLRGGNTQAALADFRSGLLSTLIDRQLGRYLPLMQGGQASAAGVGSAAMAMGGQNAGMMVNAGNQGAIAANQAGAARAGGQLAGANALTNAIGGVGGILVANWPGAGTGGTPFGGTYAAPMANPVGPSTVGMSF
jgi:hypothetical protein